MSKPSTPHRSGIRVLTIVVTLAIVLILVTFGIAAACGFADEARWQSELLALADRYGKPVVGVVIGTLLALDLFLPLPSSILMMVAGSLLGTPLGTLVGFLGAFTSACVGFFLCRRYGKPAFARFCGEEEASRVEGTLERISPWLVLGTRAAPVLAEVAACVAGLARLSWPRFITLAAVGTLPVAGIYAFAGATATEDVSRALAIGIGLPIGGFALGTLFVRRRR